jgi:hypothetical protein
LKALAATAALVTALAGCATKPPFAVTWYIVYEPANPASTFSEGSNEIFLAVLNQSDQLCKVTEIRLNGNKDWSFKPKDLIVPLERGEILLARLRDLKAPGKCVVPVSVEVFAEGELCKEQDHLLGSKRNPVVPLRAAFPSSLPEGWQQTGSCAEAMKEVVNEVKREGEKR